MRRMNVKKIIAATTLLLAAVACSKSETPSNLTSTTNAQAAAVAAAPASMPPQIGDKAEIKEMGGAVIQQAAGSEIRGTVAEALQSAGFTYARLTTANGDEWVVLDASASVAKGDAIVVRTKMIAEKFQSQSLKRTFEKVTFADLVSGGKKLPVAADARVQSAMNGEMKMPAGHPPMGGAMGDAAMGGAKAHGAATAAAATTPVKVEKAIAADARNVAEVWAERGKLKDRSVTVRGKVVKSLDGIMGKNWIHLRDGSGTPAAGDDDLTITTAENFKVGDVVTVKGTVRADKDFGAGYAYAVIVEDGKRVQ
jgi:hypothetical protein